MNDKSLNVTAVKYFVIATKVLPILIAIIHLLNTVFAFMNLTTIPLSYLGGISLFPIAYLYFASFVFKLCNYHRMFLHYSVGINSLNLYDYYIGIPVEYTTLIAIHVVYTIATMLLIIHLKFLK